MEALKRDLLVLSRNSSISEKELEKEVKMLHNMLMNVESIGSFCQVTELIDINRYKISEKQKDIEKAISKAELKPFVFLNNKN